MYGIKLNEGQGLRETGILIRLGVEGAVRKTHDKRIVILFVTEGRVHRCAQNTVQLPTSSQLLSHPSGHLY
jgi:hypothetical protein